MFGLQIESKKVQTEFSDMPEMKRATSMSIDGQLGVQETMQVQSAGTRKLVNEAAEGKAALDQSREAQAKAEAELKAALAQAEADRKALDALRAELEVAQRRLLDPAGGGSTVPYAEFAALEATAKKMQSVADETVAEFSDSPSIKQVVEMSGGSSVPPVDVMGASNMELRKAAEQLKEYNLLKEQMTMLRESAGT